MAINLLKVKTLEQLYEYVDIQYNRAKNLAKIIDSTELSQKQRYKAIKLWMILSGRLEKIMTNTMTVVRENERKLRRKFENKKPVIVLPNTFKKQSQKNLLN